jgi:hypothetical protein
MSHTRRIGVLLAVALSLAAAGCGGDEEGKPIPVATATALNNELNGVQARLDQGSSGACKDILEGPRDPNMARVQELIDAMPDDVESDVRAALEDSFDQLWDLVQQDCDDKAQEEKSQQEPEPQEPAQTDTDTTPTDTTDTTPTDTTPTDTTPTAPQDQQLPPDGDGNNGGGVPGSGNGNGNGGGVGAGAGE